MKLYSETGEFKLYHGSMLDMVNVIAPGSIDSVVTDPPYELNFMNKGWDNSGIAFQASTWRQCYTVLKPGGYLLAFGGSRTFHRIACAIEDAGFEIRDTILWMYGSGFPKSMNIGLAIDRRNGVEIVSDYVPNFKNAVYGSAMGGGNVPAGWKAQDAQNKWNGWGTALKPAYEPVIVARKPCEGSCIDNVLRYGVGGINIDECRVGVEERTYKGAGSSPQKIDNHEKGDTGIGMLDGSGKDLEFTVNGRFPANVILTYDDTDKDEVCGGMPETKSTGGCGESTRKTKFGFSDENKTGWGENQNRAHLGGLGDEGSAARYFYCAKASKRDRDEGLGKEFDSLELILYCCDGGTEIWQEKITTKEENPAMHLADMAASMQKAIAEFGIQPKSDIGLNMLLFGNSILAKYLKENKYITKMGISSTTGSKILNLLMPYTTKDYIQGANCEMEYGLSLVGSVASSNLLTITIQEKTALVRGVKPVAFKMQFRINEKEKHSIHPTVKPTELMQYLVRLVTPRGGIVLDPFNGSGSTGKATMYENRDRNAGYKYIGIELTEEYLPIADARIRYAMGDTNPVEYMEMPKNSSDQISIFDLMED